MNDPINRFQDEYEFLSSFYPVLVKYGGLEFPSLEHAYQAAKARDQRDRIRIQQARSPGEAKRMGRRVRTREQWWRDPEWRIQVMLSLVREKFFCYPELATQLVATGDRELIEGNYWKDEFWGVCNGRGENHLGKILMQVRKEVRDAQG